MARQFIDVPTTHSRLGLSGVRTWAVALTVALLAFAAGGSPAAAAEAPVPLGTTASFAVLASSTVTNTGPSLINGDVGLYSGTSITGFPPGTVVAPGTIHQTDAVAQQAQSDLVIAYNNAAGRGPGAAAGELGGRTVVGGVYTGTELSLTGTLTLDAKGNPNEVFIFQSASTLITAPTSTVALINGAQACNVYWQVGSSATLNTNTTFVGTVMAMASVSALTGTTVNGRLLARTGAVTLDTNRITPSTCDAESASPSASISPSVSVSPSLSALPSATVSPVKTVTRPGLPKTGN
ncbi:MAG TPA: ice-binding family protein [Arachnia sp.]|nr:ice-binding family protein [Arachnia sp.]